MDNQREGKKESSTNANDQAVAALVESTLKASTDAASNKQVVPPIDERLQFVVTQSDMPKPTQDELKNAANTLMRALKATPDILCLRLRDALCVALGPNYNVFCSKGNGGVMYYNVRYHRGTSCVLKSEAGVELFVFRSSPIAMQVAGPIKYPAGVFESDENPAVDGVTGTDDSKEDDAEDDVADVDNAEADPWTVSSKSDSLTRRQIFRRRMHLRLKVEEKGEDIDSVVLTLLEEAAVRWITKAPKHLDIVAANIRSEATRHFGQGYCAPWHVVVGRNFSCAVGAIEGCFVNLKIGDVRVVVFRDYYVEPQDAIQNISKAAYIIGLTIFIIALLQGLYCERRCGSMGPGPTCYSTKGLVICSVSVQAGMYLGFVCLVIGGVMKMLARSKQKRSKNNKVRPNTKSISTMKKQQ